MPVDFETEYNNRARVPEHPEIFARWHRDAAAYRERMQAEENAELGLAYARCAPEVDCSFPRRPAIRRSRCSSMAATGARSNPRRSAMSAGLNARGIGRSRATSSARRSRSQIIEQIRTACLFLWRRFGQRLMVYGHSAGGPRRLHGGDRLEELDPKAPADLVPAGYSISGLFDLKPLGGDLDEHRPQAQRASRRGGLAAVVAGAARARVRRGGRRGRVERIPAPEPHLADDWRQRGVETRYEEVPGANHFTVSIRSAILERHDGALRRTRGPMREGG